MMSKSKDILVIGAGLAGIEASLLLANAGRKVYLVERESYFGGNAIKSEEITPNMECATCMLAPKQSDLLENKNIKLMTLSEIRDISGEVGDYKIKIHKCARYVSPTSCIGCGACFEPCPVSVDNEFEEKLSKRKAIYIACAGALPNVPVIDMEHCLRAKNEDCNICKDACMFDAILYDDKDETTDVTVGAIVIATGYKLADADQLTQYGYGKFKNIFNAFEFERLRASNGPTSGSIQTRDHKEPRSIGLIHCVGRDESGYCSQVCCMYLTKFAHYVIDTLPTAKVYQFFKELSIPGKGNQKFCNEIKEKGAKLIRAEKLKISENGDGSGLKVEYQEEAKNKSIDVDMVVLAPYIKPHPSTNKLAKLLDLKLDNFGFLKTEPFNSVSTMRPGVFVIGCAEGPKFMKDVIIQAQVATAHALNATED